MTTPDNIIARDSTSKIHLTEQQVSEDFYKRRVFITDFTERKELYAKYYEKLPIQNNMIFYESMGGMRMMDNPYALFQAIYKDRRFDDYYHVWSVAQISTVPVEFRTRKNILFVTRNTDSYLRNLASAKYIICNSVLPDYFVRKPQQRYLNTWHGIAYKGIGRSSSFSPLGPNGTVSNMLQATHILTPCDFMTQLQLYGFSMHGVYSGEIAEAGYPRVDMTINFSKEQKNHLRESLGLAPGKKTILYAPTWRGEGFDADRLTEDLRALASLDANIIFMGHHLMLKHIKNVDFDGVIVAPGDTNTNELLAVVDILMTDYSSIFFDFLVTGRAIIHYMYDYEEYKATRGLNLEPSELPGEIAYTSSDMLKVADKLIREPYRPTKRYIEGRKRFCPYEDGATSEKVVDWFLVGDSARVKVIEKSKLETVVFWAGDLKDSKDGREYLQKVKEQVQSGKKIVTLVVDRSVLKNAHIIETINELGQKITVIARSSAPMVATRFEKMMKHAIERGPTAGATPLVARYYSRIYQREYRKLFGDAVFTDVVINRHSNRFWRELAKCAQKNDV